jgi:hypothetical protein
MKRSLLYSVLVLTISTTQSCKKKKVQEPEQIETPSPTISNPVTYDNYSKLKVGNYWIYQRFDIDPLGIPTSVNDFDSSFVSKDTVIHNQTYYKYHTLNQSPSYLRDSLHYLINSKGDILFSSQDFTTIFKTSYDLNAPSDTIDKGTFKMTDKDSLVITLAGNFITSNFQKKYLIYPAWQSDGNIRYYNTRYSKNIGVIIRTQNIFLSTKMYFERRLVRYHLN